MLHHRAEPVNTTEGDRSTPNMSIRYFSLVLVILLSASSAQAQEPKPASPTFTIAKSVLIATAAADIATSTYAFGKGTGKEVLLGPSGNPLAFGLLKGGMTAVAIYGAERLRKTKPKAAVFYLFAISSLEITLAAHNAKVGGR